MFPPPSSRNKNKKHLSILASSPDPLLHSTPSELSPPFSPDEFLNLLRRDDGAGGSSSSGSGRSSSSLSSGFPRTSPLDAEPSASSHAYYPGQAPAAGDDFRFSLEVESSTHASPLSLQLDSSPFSPPIEGLSQPLEGRSLLSPLFLTSFSSNTPIVKISDDTSPSSPTANSSECATSNLSTQSEGDASLAPQACLGVFHSQSVVALDEASTSDNHSSSISVRSAGLFVPSSLPRPPLVSHNSAPAVPFAAPRTNSPKAKAPMPKQKRSTSSLRVDSVNVSPETAQGIFPILSVSPSALSTPSAAGLTDLLPIVPRDEIPSSQKSHAATRSPNYTPRPPNSWILYRSETIKQMKLAKSRGEEYPVPPAVLKHPDVITSKDGVMAQADVSKMVALMWRLEGKEVKAKYEHLSAIRKLEHAEMYPEYKYQPARKPTTNTPAVKGKSSLKKPASSSPLVTLPANCPLPTPPMSASTSDMSKASKSTSGTSKPSSAVKRTKSLKKKKSRSTLSSRPSSPSSSLQPPPSVPQLPRTDWPFTHSTMLPQQYLRSTPQPGQVWSFSPPANAFYPHPLPTLPNSIQTFDGAGWVHHPTPPAMPPYFPPNVRTPDSSGTSTPHENYNAPAAYAASAVHSPPHTYGSPGAFEPQQIPYPQEHHHQPSYDSISPPPPHANFDGIAFTQIIDDSYIDADYQHQQHQHTPFDVAFQPAQVYGVPATSEVTLAATWSLLEDDDYENEPVLAESAGGVRWSSQGEWIIDPRHH